MSRDLLASRAQFGETQSDGGLNPCAQFEETVGAPQQVRR